MSTDYHDLKNIEAETRRENATDCDECGVEFGSGAGKVRKARGIISKDFPGTAMCVECAEEIYGDENIDGEPIADDETLATRGERAEQAQVEAYHGGLSGGSINEQCDRDREESRRLHS